MKTKILIIEHDSNDMELIQDELKKGNVNFITEIVETKIEYTEALHTFKPDIILSNYTFPAFDGLTALKIREKLVPQTPFIFVSESIDHENTKGLIKNGVTDFVLKKRLYTLIDKVNLALQEAELTKINTLLKQSEEKRTEELSQYESKYQSLVESSMDAILLTVKDGRILTANTAACEIFKMTNDEICNLGRLDIVDMTDPRLQILVEDRDRTGRAKGELTFVRKDGSKFPGEITTVVFIDVNGNEKTSMTIRDFTDRKKAELNLELRNKELAFQNGEKEIRAAELITANKELAFQNDEKENRAAELVIANKELAFQNDEKESRAAELVIANDELAFQNEEKENRATELIITNNELRKTNQELDRFVYSVSHDLRSPLTSVLGLLSFIEEETKEDDTLEHAKMIRKSINRLDVFIKNILSYSRNNRVSLEVEMIPIRHTATAIVDSLRSMKEAKGILFQIDISEKQPFYSDSLRFNTILENLISNAIKHHKKDSIGRYIKIEGRSDRDKLQLSISDNGIGIALENQTKIFDMFFRLSGVTDGSGIGLYIVKETVEILQGSVEIQSEKGIGTTFTITLKNLKP